MKKLLISLSLFVATLPCFADDLSYSIAGLKDEPLKNVQQRLEIQKKSISGKLRQDQIERLYQDGLLEIKSALTPFGYFNATVKGRLKHDKPQHWTASYQVRPGSQVMVSAFSLQITGEAATDPAFIALRKNLAIKKGDALISKNYSKAKQQLLDLAAARGYFDAELKHSQARVSLQAYQASIHLHLASGPRYHFGRVSFGRTKEASQRLANKFLFRFIRFKIGDAFDNQKLLALQRDLASSHYFSSVSVAPLPKRASGREVPIQVDLTPVKGKRYTLGAGIGTDTGIRGLAGVKLRRLSNFGHYFGGDTKFAIKDGEFQGFVKASYNIPGRNPITDLYTFSASLEQDDSNNIGVGQVAKLNANYLTQVLGWQQSTGLTLQVEQSDPRAESEFTTILLMPNVQWSKTKSDDPLRPNNGYSIKFAVRGASEMFLSKTDILKAELNLKYIRSLTRYQRLILRGDLGGVLINDIDDLPLSMRFVAGGAQSVRGYGYRNIGPGRTKVVGSIELQQKIYKDFYLTGFYDVGNVSSSYATNYSQSIGTGIVWRSPIGAIALTLAQAISKPGKPLLVEFSMGPEL